jgi:radical SAM protein with 4Fe4S-binding SPASM domain
MEWSLFEAIAEQLPSGPSGPAIALQLHNEPLLDKRVLDAVKHIKRKTHGAHLTIVTNGTLLGEFEPAEVAQSGLDQLIISLNAHSETTYEHTNAGLSYEKVMNNVSSVLSNKVLRQRVVLSFVVTRQNWDEVHQAIRYWKAQGVRTRVVRVANRAGALDSYEGIKPASLYFGDSFRSSALGRLIYGAGRVTGCPFPFYQMNILFNGDCIVCCHDWNRATVVGNVARTPLEDVWNSQEMNRVRRSLLRRQYGKVEACAECSLAR